MLCEVVQYVVFLTCSQITLQYSRLLHAFVTSVLWLHAWLLLLGRCVRGWHHCWRHV